MAQFFSASEIAKAAVEIEKKGQDFYRRVAANAKTESLKALFSHLQKEEMKHERIFSELLARLGAVELPAWSNDEEYAMYVNALIESHALFTGGLAEKYMAEATDDKTAIRMAMAFEKDTLLFFMEMRELVPDSEQKFVQQCIEEERLHLRQLQAML